MTTSKNSYQNLNRELEEILAKLQSADLDVDEAMKAYERGTVVAKELEKYLKNAENVIKKVKADFSKK